MTTGRTGSRIEAQAVGLVLVVGMLATACGDDGQGGGGAAGGDSGDGGGAQTGGGGAGEGGAGVGGVGPGGAGQGGSMSTTSGGGIQGACEDFCATLFRIDCVEDEAQCVDGCLIQSEGDPCPMELAAWYHCVADFAMNCADAAPECDDESLVYEMCLGD